MPLKRKNWMSIYNLRVLWYLRQPSPWKHPSVEKFREEWFQKNPRPEPRMICGTHLMAGWPGETEPPEPDEDTGGYQEPDHIRKLRLAMSWGLNRTIERGDIVEVPLDELGPSTSRDSRKVWPEAKARPPRRPREAHPGRHKPIMEQSCPREGTSKLGAKTNNLRLKMPQKYIT